MYKNTFTVPDDDDDDDDDDDVEIVESPSKPASKPVEPSSESSDFDYGSDISRPLDLTSPGTSPEAKQSDLPKPTPVGSSSALAPESDPMTSDQDPQLTRSSPPGSFPIDFCRSDETDSEFDEEDDAISESYNEWVAKRDEPHEFEDSVADEVLMYDSNDDNDGNEGENGDDKEDYNEQVKEAPHKATSPAPETDLPVPPPIVNEVELHLPRQKETVHGTTFTTDHLATAGNPSTSFAGPSVLDDASVVAPAAQGPSTFIPVLRQDTSAMADFQSQLRDYEMQRVPSPSDKAMARPPQYNFYEGWSTGMAPWDCFRPSPASESFPFGPHRSTGYLRNLTNETGSAQPFVGSQGLNNKKAAEPAKARVSIADIVEAADPLSLPPKRKANEFESDLDDLKLNESQEDTQEIQDAQPRPELNTILVSGSQLPASTPVNGRKESRRKRIKTRQSSGIVKYATAAVIGAVVGGISTVAALAALPSDYFE